MRTTDVAATIFPGVFILSFIEISIVIVIVVFLKSKSRSKSESKCVADVECVCECLRGRVGSLETMATSVGVVRAHMGPELRARSASGNSHFVERGKWPSMFPNQASSMRTESASTSFSFTHLVHISILGAPIRYHQLTTESILFPSIQFIALHCTAFHASPCPIFLDFCELQVMSSELRIAIHDCNLVSTVLCKW